MACRPDRDPADDLLSLKVDLGADALSDDRNWKNGLLHSGLPLEFEVGKLLVSKGFCVDSDFCCAGSDSAAIRDVSVDVHARATMPPSSPPEVTGALDLVVQCKAGHGGARWLFLPDPNEPHDSPAASADVIRAVDHFSPHFIDAEAAGAFDGVLPICGKGVEIDTATGEVGDSELRQGLAQLRSALPRLLVRNVLFYLGDEVDDNVPFLFCPILLTEAELLLAREGFSVQEVERSAEIEELSDRVPYLVVYSDYGPEFEFRCGQEFRAFDALARSEKVVAVEERRAATCRNEWELPFAIMESLMAAERRWLHRFFTQFVICTKSELAALVDVIQQVAASAIPSRGPLD